MMAQAVAPVCAHLPCGNELLKRGSFLPKNPLRSVLGCCTSSSSCQQTSALSVRAELGSQAPVLRREVLLGALVAASSTVLPLPAQAVRRREQKVGVEEFEKDGSGLLFHDYEVGRGPVAQNGEKVLVHFDVVYKTLTVVSSRESKLLGGNRIIAEPYEFVVGSKPGSERKRDFVENANGLFSAQASPKPPPALYTATAGMHVGGKRTILVPPEEGYGKKGFAEIPPDATFELNIELLKVLDN